MTLTNKYQHGATLIVGLIMLAVITLLVSSAFTLSSTNQKAVGNMQFRNEAAAAASYAIEQVMSGFDLASPVAQDIAVDMNNDGEPDYTVSIIPTCITSSAVAESSQIGKQGGVELGEGLSVGGSGSTGGFLTIWDIDATVTEKTSGASIRMHQGVRKLMVSNCA